MEYKIEAELKRIGVDHAALGPVDSICVSVNGPFCQMWDDHAKWIGTPETALARLKMLPDGAGYDAFWLKFLD